MSRPLRFSYAGAMHHATLRCNNREFLFDEPAFAEELDFYPIFLGLGPDRAGRYAGHVRVLEEELGRLPVSLATEYFVGRGRFVRRMATRFGLAGPGAYTRRGDLGGGVEGLGPRVGRSVAGR